MNKNLPLFIFFTITITILVSACASNTALKPNHGNQKVNLENTFFDNLKSLCGQQFVGKTVYPDDPSDSFAGKKLVANLKSCNDNEIRIPFIVGQDHSRTWVITKTTNGLLLKHDHRHEDGTPDEITMYGGYAGDYKGQQGTEFQQYFLADKETAALIPAAATNVWMLQYNPADKTLTYYLERNAKARYKAILK